jgi:hypothetical protein
MKKYYRRPVCYALILLVLTISMGLWQATGLTEEQPVQATPERHQSHSTKPEGMSKMFEGTVAEIIDSGRHTYVRVNTGEELIWFAVPAFDGKSGDKVLVPPGVPVADLHSEKLNRTFKMIYFVGGIRRLDKNSPGQEKSMLPKNHPATTQQAENRMIHPSMDDFTTGPAVDIGEVEKAEGGKTVFEIISERDKLAGKTIMVRAKVTRFTPNIMGKNWIRVRDGSGDRGQNELVVTTSDEARIGDVILIRGIVSVDRDLGFGKKYLVIVENAEITVE